MHSEYIDIQFIRCYIIISFFAILFSIKHYMPNKLHQNFARSFSDHLCNIIHEY